jgi:hypothetical protein
MPAQIEKSYVNLNLSLNEKFQGKDKGFYLVSKKKLTPPKSPKGGLGGTGRKEKTGSLYPDCSSVNEKLQSLQRMLRPERPHT